MNKTWMMLGLVGIMLAIGYVTASTPLEIVATVTGLLSVWLTARENIWAWPTGLISVACFFYMFWEVNLYADMTLQVVFFVLSIYGWIIWLTKRGDAKVRPSRRIQARAFVVLLISLFVVSIVWGYLLAQYTDASIPYVDAFIATLSLIAQYLLSNKVLENWYCWLLVDVLSIGMYTYKGLYTLTFLYVVFLGIAAMGLYSWKKQWKADQQINQLASTSE